MRIGIITAMAAETLPIYQKLGNIVAESTISGVRVVKIEISTNTIYLATSGVGEIKAALAAQLLKDLFDVEAILNFGFVGAINKALSVGEVVLADRVCHYQFDTSLLDGTRPGQYGDQDGIYFYLDGSIIERVISASNKNLRRVTVASGDVFVASKEQKEKLRRDFGADICEMELAGLAIACERNNIPLFSMKVVSDNADGSAKESFTSIVARSLTKYEELLPAVLKAVTGDASPLPPVKK